MNSVQRKCVGRVCSGVLVCCSIVVGLAGCKRQNLDEDVQKIQAGMSRAEVEAILGPGKDVPPHRLAAGVLDGKPDAKVEEEQWDDGKSLGEIIYIDGKVGEWGTRGKPRQ